METLTDLASRFNSDKYFRHSYVQLYSQLFEPFRQKRVNVFEFGVGYKALMEPFVPSYVEASSLKMWEEYFPLGNIYAADHNPSTLVNKGRIRSFRADQSRYDDLLELRGKLPASLSIIIDDASHLLEYQIMTAAVLLQSLASPGVMIIEDCYQDKGTALATMFGGTLHYFGKTSDDGCVVIQR